MTDHTQPPVRDVHACTYHVIGVPLRTGSFMPGSENDAQPWRDAQFVARLQAAGCTAIDAGDVAIPSYLPHHAIPPIRNWPGPRIAWECVADHIAPLLQQPGHVPLLIGCDCSVVVGTTQALMRATSPQDVYLLYVDGDFDDARVSAERTQSAAALAVWLATEGAAFRAGPSLPSSQVTVIGWTMPAEANPDLTRQALSLADVRRIGGAAAARHALARVPASASIVVHFDVDVFQRTDLPATYFPHAEGLTLTEGRDLLRGLLPDPRVRVIEVAEYASLRDGDQRSVTELVDLMVEGLRRA